MIILLFICHLKVKLLPRLIGIPWLRISPWGLLRIPCRRWIVTPLGWILRTPGRWNRSSRILCHSRWCIRR